MRQHVRRKSFGGGGERFLKWPAHADLDERGRVDRHLHDIVSEFLRDDAVCAEVDGVVGLAGVCGAALILLSIFIPQLWEKCRQKKTTLQGEWL